MDFLYRLLSVVIKTGFWSSVVIVFITLLTLILSLVLISLNGSVVMDLYYMIQLWLPFNLNVILTWIITLVLAYTVYRLALWAFIFVGELLRS